MSRNIIEAHGRKYFRDLRKLVKASRQKVWQAYQNEIRPRIHEYRRLTNNSLTANHFRVNDSLSEIQRILERVRQETGEDIFNSMLVEVYVREFAENTNQRARKEFRGQVQDALDSDPTDNEPWLESFLETAIQENVKWIKSIDRQHHDTIETVVLQGTRRNVSLNEMASDIASAGDTAMNKARFIARDQTGSLYGDLMKRRHSEAGLRRFRWRSSGDERVRDSHEDLDGQIFNWSDGTVRKTKRKDGSVSSSRRIWPGTDYGCRCTPEVIEDDLFSETEESG